eukprot:TRINITY_DN25518_c0_g1_i1.p1 TRINITY_DN25518_c0_g1~~TRINITY_DN25518_c0_g1_i1.p1  ORF type:complete len:263 (-),score=38.81 TRINITY_DN25518_c0_g1_i1:65-853(-)
MILRTGFVWPFFLLNQLVLVSGKDYKSFRSAKDFKDSFRVCNAYPAGADSSALTLSIGKNDIGGGPLSYKDCRDLSDQVKEGDKIDFKVDGAIVGAFTLSDLPDYNAVLLLLVHKRGLGSDTASFVTHSFRRRAKEAQVVVLDAYSGSIDGTPVISDAGDAENSRSQKLSYGSVLAVKQGDYEVDLQGESGEKKGNFPFTVKDGQTYAIVRVGDEGTAEQDVLFYPKPGSPESEDFKNGATGIPHSPACLLFVALLLSLQLL